METVINKCQNIIDNIDYTSSITYENTIIPEASKILNELNNTKPSQWLRKIDLSKKIDIYVETLAIHMLYTYTKGTNFDYPLHSIAIVLIKHPFFINMFQCGKNITEWKKFVSDVNNEIISMYGETNSSSAVNNLRKILNQDCSTSSSPLSSIHKFHYLTDFWFVADTTGLSGNELLNKMTEGNLIDDGTIFVSINVAYNLHNLQSIVIYKNIPKLREKILNINTIDSLNPFKYPSQVIKPTKEFYILNNKLERLNELPSTFSKCFVLISYNDSESFVSSHYSLANFGENKYLTPEQTKKFIDYKVLKIVNSEIFDYYLKEEFYNKIGSDKRNISDLKKDYIKLIQLTTDVFHKSTQKNFGEKLYSQIETLSLIDSHELPYFKIYLSKIIEPFDLQTVLNYVTGYIYPDLLVSSSSI